MNSICGIDCTKCELNSTCNSARRGVGLKKCLLFGKNPDMTILIEQEGMTEDANKGLLKTTARSLQTIQIKTHWQAV